MFLTDFLFLEIYRHGFGALSYKIKFIFQVRTLFHNKIWTSFSEIALLRYRSVGGAVHGSESKDRWKRRVKSCWGEKMTWPPTLGLATLW